MNQLSDATCRAARSAAGDVKILHGRVRDQLSGSEIGEVVEAVINAVLPAVEGDVSEQQRRSIEFDTLRRVRSEFRIALNRLPEIAPPDVAHVLSGVMMAGAFIREGKRLQREHGTTAVPPRVEQECGAGVWSFMRNGIRAGLDTTPGEALIDKLDRFKRVLAIHDALPENLRPDDDAPLRAILPGVWPKVRHLRELVSLLSGTGKQGLAEKTVTIYKTAAVGPTCLSMALLVPTAGEARSVVTTSFLHRLIENAYSWALQGCNYLDPKIMDRLIAETQGGMKPEQAATWDASQPQTRGSVGRKTGEPDFAKSIGRVIEQESLGGAACGWQPCTGCHETIDGQSIGDYPVSPTFGCEVGSGCHECGGLGVVWRHYDAKTLADMERATCEWACAAVAPECQANSQGSLDSSDYIKSLNDQIKRLTTERDGWRRIVGDIASGVPVSRVVSATSTVRDLVAYFQKLEQTKRQLVEALRTLIFVCDERWEGKFPETEVDAARAVLAAAKDSARG